MANEVIILKDESGNYYILGATILDDARVRTEEHIKLLDQLVSGRQPRLVGTINNIELTSYGATDVKADRFLRLSYSSPKFTVLSSHPNPS